MSQTRSKETQRIAKLLARAGIASRREVERMIAEGRVALNGVVIDTPATVLQSLHGITVDGEPVAAPAPARLYRFHKPAGVLTTERDPGGRRTIYDVLPKELPRLVPVGRLDLNTEGLLLLTTDGELKRQLELPATGVERSYRARTYGQVSQAQLEELIEGVTIDGVRYGSIDANLERRTGANVWVELTLTEGKNREVRRVLEHLGLKVSRLIRTRYGPFHLLDLDAGEVEEVRQHDLVAFRKALAGPGGGKAASALQFALRPKERPEPKRADAAPAAKPNRAARRADAIKTKPDAAPKKRDAALGKPFSPRTPRPGASSANPRGKPGARRREEEPRTERSAKPGRRIGRTETAEAKPPFPLAEAGREKGRTAPAANRTRPPRANSHPAPSRIGSGAMKSRRAPDAAGDAAPARPSTRGPRGDAPASTSPPKPKGTKRPWYPKK